MSVIKRSSTAKDPAPVEQRKSTPACRQIPFTNLNEVNSSSILMKKSKGSLESTNDWDDSEEDEYGELTVENIEESTPERSVGFVSPEKSKSGEDIMTTGTNLPERTVRLVSPEKSKSGIEYIPPEDVRVVTVSRPEPNEGDDLAANKTVNKKRILSWK